MGHLARDIPIHFAAALLLCVLWAGSGLIYRQLLGMEPMGAPLQAMEGWFLITLPFGVAVYFAVLGVEHATVYYAEAREREVHAARLASQLAEARLGALRSQLNPHFLFNSLNAITVLVRDQDTATASRMLEQPGDVLRQALQTDRSPEIPLAEEIGFLKRYLAIEQVRFSDRLRATFDVDPETTRAAVPSFVLQPLVENALRHGLARRTEGGALTITARREPGRGRRVGRAAGGASGGGLGAPRRGGRGGTVATRRKRAAHRNPDRHRPALSRPGRDRRRGPAAPGSRIPGLAGEAARSSGVRESASIRAGAAGPGSGAARRRRRRVDGTQVPVSRRRRERLAASLSPPRR